LKALKENYQPELPQQLEANLRALDRYNDEKRRNSEAMEQYRVQCFDSSGKNCSHSSVFVRGGSSGAKEKERIPSSRNTEN
jgi:hypothetical protein